MESAQIYSNTGDTAIQRNLSALRFLAKVKRGEKINCRDLFVRDNDSILQRVLRTMRNMGITLTHGDIVESKEATLLFIRTVIDESITLIAVYRTDADEFKQSIANIIGEQLERSKRGIGHLIETYSDDRKFISEAESVLLTLDARVDSMVKKGYIQGVSSKSFMPQLNHEIDGDDK